jgi:4-hydroxy-tetrahydrodipicolinate synthase
MEAKTVARLSEIKNIAGIKEAGGDMSHISYLRALTPPDFLIYSGNDSDTLPMLTLGCAGVISVLSHVAGKPFRRMMEAFWSGDVATARELHLRLLPVCDALFPPTTPSPAPVKAGLQLQGFDCGGLRLPLVEATETERENLRVAMERAELL